MHTQAVQDTDHQPEDPMKRILVVDDEPGILVSLSQLISSSYDNCLVGTASSAEEAMDLLKVSPVDLLITDLKLPNMDGLSLAKNTRKSSPKTRSILITAFGTNEINSDAYDLGCVAYLEKPFDVDTLLKSIEQTFLVDEVDDAVTASLSVAEVIQSCALSDNKRVTISISSNGSAGMLYLEHGLIQHAEFDDLKGGAALVAILGCKSPTITTLAKAPRSKFKPLGIPWQAAVAASRVRSVPEQFRMLKGKNIMLQVDDTNELRAIYRTDRYPSNEDLLIDIGMSFGDPYANLQEMFYRSTPDDLLGRCTLASEYERKRARVRNLVNTGVEHFRLDELEKARRCWLAALRIDPDCRQAKRNIAVVRKLISKDK